MKSEYVGSLSIAVISFLACGGAWKLGVGQVGSPGPGFFPLVLGGAAGVLSLVTLAGQLWKGRTLTPAPRAAMAGGIIKVAYILAALIVYGLLLERIGYVLTTVVIFGFLLRLVSTQKWRFVVGGAVVVALASFILFAWALGVSLPKGPLGI